MIGAATSTRIRCPECAAAIAPDDLNVQALVGKCGACGAVFGFADQVRGAGAPAEPPTAWPRPAAWTEREVGAWGGPKTHLGGDYRTSARVPADALVLTRHWRGAELIFLTLFVAFWDAFLVFWYGIAFTQGSPLIMVLFPLLHVAVGVGLTYYVVAGFLNRTVVHASDDALRVTMGPLPWPRGNRAFPADDVRRFFAGEGEHDGGTVAFRTSRRHAAATVSVDVGGTRHELLSHVRTPAEARWLAQRLAAHYGVPAET